MAGPRFSPVQDVDVIGGRFCAALHELFSFAWSSDPTRFNRMMDDGGCYPAASGIAFDRIEHGEEASLFRMVIPVTDRNGEAPALWFRKLTW